MDKKSTVAQTRLANLAKAREAKLEKLKKKQTPTPEPEPAQPEPEQQQEDYTYSYSESDSDEIYIKPKAKPKAKQPKAKAKAKPKVKETQNDDLRNELNDLKSMIASLNKPKKRNQRTNKTVVQIVNPQQTEKPQADKPQKENNNEDYLKYFKF